MAFHGCDNLSGTLVIPASVTNINASAFAYCPLLTGLSFEENSALVSIGSSFSGCTSLTGNIALPSGVTEIGDSAFANTKITSIDFPANLASIGAHAFKGSNLASVNIPAGIQIISDSCFEGCASLSQVTFTTGSNLKKVGKKAFYGCVALTAFVFPANYKNIDIDEEAFMGCTTLSAVNFSSSVYGIDHRAFKNCAITSLSLTGVHFIGHETFSGNALNTVYIPDSVKIIGNNAFSNMTTTINCQITQAEKPAYAEGYMYHYGIYGWHDNFHGGNTVNWGVAP